MKKIKYCDSCPLKGRHKVDCGKVIPVNLNGAMKYIKIPDDRCKLLQQYIERNQNE